MKYPHLTSEGLRLGIADTLNRVGFKSERIIVERHGKPLAAIVPLADLERLEALEEAEDLRAAQKARKEKGGATLADLKKELGL